jgi:hypothetical protein
MSEPPKAKGTFLQTAYQIFANKEFMEEGICGWTDDGRSIIVHDQEEFRRRILPNYFKHEKFPSFVRQLNMYGFHKASGSGGNKSENVFHHEDFVRDRPDLLSRIKRMANKKDAVPPPSTSSRLRRSSKNGAVDSEEDAENRLQPSRSSSRVAGQPSPSYTTTSRQKSDRSVASKSSRQNTQDEEPGFAGSSDPNRQMYGNLLATLVDGFGIFMEGFQEILDSPNSSTFIVQELYNKLFPVHESCMRQVADIRASSALPVKDFDFSATSKSDRKRTNKSASAASKRQKYTHNELGPRDGGISSSSSRQEAEIPITREHSLGANELDGGDMVPSFTNLHAPISEGDYDDNLPLRSMTGGIRPHMNSLNEGKSQDSLDPATIARTNTNSLPLPHLTRLDSLIQTASNSHGAEIAGDVRPLHSFDGFGPENNWGKGFPGEQQVPVSADQAQSMIIERAKSKGKAEEFGFKK